MKDSDDFQIWVKRVGTQYVQDCGYEFKSLS